LIIKVGGTRQFNSLISKVSACPERMHRFRRNGK